MKRWIPLLCCLLLLGCGPKEEETDLLTPPGLRWGMTYAEVQEALNFREEQVVGGHEDERHRWTATTYRIQGVRFFGREASLVILEFYAFPDQPESLVNVKVHYPDGTDRASLVRDLSKRFGECSPQRVWKQWNYFLGEQEEYTDEIPDTMNLWLSRMSMLNAMELEHLERIYPMVMDRRREEGYEKLPTFEQYLTTLDSSIAMMVLYTDYSSSVYHDMYTEEMREEGWTDMVLNIDGTSVWIAANMEEYAELG